MHSLGTPTLAPQRTQNSCPVPGVKSVIRVGTDASAGAADLRAAAHAVRYRRGRGSGGPTPTITLALQSTHPSMHCLHYLLAVTVPYEMKLVCQEWKIIEDGLPVFPRAHEKWEYADDPSRGLDGQRGG